MATLGTTQIQGDLTLQNAASAYDHPLRFGEFQAEIDSILSQYAHSPVTYGESKSILFVITGGQRITPTLRVATGDSLLEGMGRIGIATTGSGPGVYALLGTGAYDAAAGNHGHDLADADNPGFLSASGFSKLSAIQAAATANYSNDFLLSRANHTGTQGWSSIYDFADGVTLYAIPSDGGEFTGLVSFDPAEGGMFSLPVLTTTERDALTPGIGWKIYNLTALEEQVWNGSDWVAPATGTATDVGFTSVYGDLTISSVYQATIGAGVVTNAKLATMQTGRLLGRTSSGIGAPEYLEPGAIRSLLNVANGATANLANATLLARENHTGTQYASTISDFDEAVATYAISRASGGAVGGAITFTGTDHAGVQLNRLTSAQIAALELGASDKGFAFYNITSNRFQGKTATGLLDFLMDGDGGDFLRADGTNAGTGKQELLQVKLADPELLTIADGAITVTKGFHRVRPDSALGYYAVSSIYGGASGGGDILDIIPEPDEPTWYFEHGVGNVYCATGEDIYVGSVYDRVQGIYDHLGYWRIGKAGAGGGTGGGDSELPVLDSSALVRDPSDATKQVGLDAGSVTTGNTRRIQSPDGDSRMRETIAFMVFDEDTSIDLAQHDWDVFTVGFTIEYFDIVVLNTTGAASNVSVVLKKNGATIATATANQAANAGPRAWGRAPSLSTTSLVAGDVVTVTPTGNGEDGSGGTAAAGLIVKLIGYYQHA